MMARRTDGSEFPVEVTSANLEDGRAAYGSAFEAAWADHDNHYTGDELLMLVVRDLAGTLDIEAELARQQRQTEMILRAASEGVVGVDTEGRIVLVNPSAAQILGYRAGDLGGQELHPLVHHSQPDGSPLPYEETPLADTLRSGRKHRMRAGQVLWAKDGRAVPVDMTTAPVRDGEQLVGAVMTFTDRSQQLATAARHEQLAAVLERRPARATGTVARRAGRTGRRPGGPAVARGQPDPAPPGRRVRPHDDARGQRARLPAAGRRAGEAATSEQAGVDTVVSAGVEAAVELIGPGRAQFAVHAPPIQAKVDPERLATALAHLIADVAGVDATGTAAAGAGSDSTIVVAAAQRGDVVRIEVRGPHGGGSPVHEPVVRGIVTRHGGILQTHEVPGSGTSAYVLEVPGALGMGITAQPERPQQADGTGEAGGTDGAQTPSAGDAQPVLARDGHSADAGQPPESPPAVEGTPSGNGRRRRAPAPPAVGLPALPPRSTDADAPAAGAVAPVPHQSPSGRGFMAPAENQSGRGRRARRALAAPPAVQEETPAPQAQQNGTVPAQLSPGTGRRRARTAADQEPGDGSGGSAGTGEAAPQQVAHGTGRRARRAPEGLPAAENGRPQPVNGTATPLGTGATSGGIPAQVAPGTGRRGRPADSENAPAADRGAGGGPFALPPGGQAAAHGAPTADGELPAVAGGGRRARRLAAARARAESQAAGQSPSGSPFALPPATADRPEGGAPAAAPQETAEVPPQPEGEPASAELSRVAASPILGGGPLPERALQQHRPALPSAAGHDTHTAEEHASGGISVRTLGQGVRFTPHPGDQQATPAGSGRRRRLAAPPDAAGGTNGAAPGAAPHAASAGAPQLPGRAREFAIGAPAAGAAEGPEPLDGPNGAVEVTDDPQMTMSLRAVDDELPPEPLDNPRRLLVWPEPDVSTQQALSARGYRPVIVHSREEVDAQIAAYPAALFVDPLTGPITRTALQSLRQAAVAAEVPVLVTAGLGQAARDAAYGADPAVLLKALAPRDSDEQPPRVLLVEERQPVAAALGATLERRGMQVVHAPSDAEAVPTAAQVQPNLVVMDLMQIRRRRAGIIDWLRVNGLLNRTPFVVYTSADMDAGALPRLQSGETVLFLAERSTSGEVQTRIVDLLAKIGAN